MRRFLHILLNAATVLSLVLCAVTMAAWCAGGRWGGPSHGDFTAMPAGSQQHFFEFNVGWNSVYVGKVTYYAGATEILGMASGGMTLPCWAVVLLFACLPTSHAILAWSRREPTSLRVRRAGFCSVCNYDLRATPDCCPECGAVSNGCSVRNQV